AVAERLERTIEWHHGIAESLPFADQTFDAVVSQFALMFFSDKRKALLEMLRVLLPGGNLAVAVWDSLDNNPAYARGVELLQQNAGTPAADALRAPFVLGDRKKLSTLFSEAGMPSAKITTHRGTGNFPNIQTMIEAELRGWLPVMGVILTEDQISRILEEAEHALKSYVTKDGTVAFPLSVQLVTAKKT
ncbi:MAG TPA: methyltransferase domain-containing protein, partial [Acidobacteriota bacterium]|nr:methyltransferase domain-containing protein [Acidobacteriota bacterium]